MDTTRFSARLQYQDGQLRLDAGTHTPQLVERLGFLTAGLLAGLCVLELFSQGLMFASMGSGALATNSAYYFAQAIAFMTAPLFVVMMACLFGIAGEENKTFALIGVAFAVAYAVLGGINYYIQLTAVRLAAANGQLEAIAPFFMPNMSAMFAFDILGYFFLTLATLAVVPLFTRAGLERGIRWVLVINFFIGVSAVIGNLIGEPGLLIPILPASWIAAGAATALVAVWFRRALVGSPAAPR